MAVKKNLPSELSLTQAAKILGISRQSVWEAIKKGRIKARKVGNQFTIRRDAINKYDSAKLPPGRPRKKK